MNKEILFRGKRVDNGRWVYGNLIINKECQAHRIVDGFGLTGDMINGDNICFGDFYLVDPATVGQFTGLTDKNGVKIFEGDLLSDPFPIDEEDLIKGYHESFLPVVWCSKTLQWCVDASFAKDSSFLTSLVEYFGEFLEVKGNIHDNPELIKQ